MTNYDHQCPAIGNGKPNMSKDNCSARIASGDRKCGMCPAGVGYVKPVRKKPGRKPRATKAPVKRTCSCGRERERNYKWCAECLEINRVNGIKKYRIKLLTGRIERDQKTIAKITRSIKPRKELSAM